MFKSVPNCHTTYIALKLLVFILLAVLTACDGGDPPAQSQEFLQYLAIEDFDVPNSLFTPEPGKTAQILTPIMQDFGAGEDLSLAIYTPQWVSHYEQYVIVRGRVGGEYDQDRPAMGKLQLAPRRTSTAAGARTAVRK